MLKVFQAAESGESAEFWDANWARTELADPITVCEQDPVWPLVMRTLRPGDQFLEGGCGQGQWVRYLTGRGQRALGVDFAENNIARLRSAYPECRFELGDITKLTLPDESIDVYYSAGVVEHFERGPEVALREAHRVLRPGGTFLCSVPDASPLRRFLYRRDRGVHASTGWRVRHVERTEEEAAPGGLSFFQYIFAEDEFRARLEAAGFVVRESIGMYLTWGLLEIPAVSTLFPLALDLGRKLRGRVAKEAAPSTPQAAATTEARPNVPVIRRVLVNEDRDVPLLGQAIKLGARLFPKHADVRGDTRVSMPAEMATPLQAPDHRVPTRVLRPKKGWIRLDLRELFRYRDLLWFLTKRDISLRYRQTALGVAWAVIQPLATMAVFTIFFGRFGKIPSDGVPYPLFAFCGLIPWQLFAYALAESSNSLINNQSLVTKVYFPRLVIPLSAVLSGLLDLVVSMVLLIGMLAWFGKVPTIAVLLIPAFVLLTIVAALGVGLWLSALNVQYRDIRYTIPFLTQIWFFATPIAYPASMVPAKFRALLGLNPMAGVVEGFRWALLGTGRPGGVIWVSIAATAVVLVGGLYYFSRMERRFADLV